MAISATDKSMGSLAQRFAALEERQSATMTPGLRLKSIEPEEWDVYASGFDGAVQEQLYAFAQNRWPNVTPEPWLFTEGDEVVGGVLMMVQGLPLKLGSIAVSKWGPIFADDARADADRLYAGAIEALVEEYADKRGMMLSVLPRAEPRPGNIALDYLKGRGFSAGSKLPFPDRYFVRLKLDDETLLKSFGQKWRYHLKKSFKESLDFEVGAPTRAEEFDVLYNAMTNRKQFPDHSAYDDTFDALMAIKDPQLRPKLFFVRHKGEIVAGSVIFAAGDKTVYLYGATNDRALPLRAGYFMHWHIIRWLRDNTSAHWYDLGGTDGFQGLHQFKKGMVGTTGEIRPVPPVMNYASALKARLLGNAAFKARDWLSQFMRVIERMRSATKPDQER